MRVLSDEMSVGSVKEITTHFEGNPGYTIAVGYGEMLIGETIDFIEDLIPIEQNIEYDSYLKEYESILCEMPENDYHKFNGNNHTALYGVRHIEEIKDDTYMCQIVRIK